MSPQNRESKIQMEKLDTTSRRTNTDVKRKTTNVNVGYVAFHQQSPQFSGVLVQVVGGYILRLWSFFVCFLYCFANIQNLLLVVPETRIVVNVRLCAFVDHCRLTRNLKNRPSARKLWGLCFWPFKAPGSDLCKTFSFLSVTSRDLEGSGWILRSCIVELRVLQNPPRHRILFLASQGWLFSCRPIWPGVFTD